MFKRVNFISYRSGDQPDRIHGLDDRPDGAAVWQQRVPRLLRVLGLEPVLVDRVRGIFTLSRKLVAQLA